jgi:hypothetical protein
MLATKKRAQSKEYFSCHASNVRSEQLHRAWTCDCFHEIAPSHCFPKAWDHADDVCDQTIKAGISD